MDLKRRRTNAIQVHLAKKSYRDDTWMIEHGFCSSGNQLQCLLCDIQFPESSTKEEHLTRHLASTHPSEKNYPKDYFLNKYNKLKDVPHKVEHFSDTLTDSNIYKAYMLALRLARSDHPKKIVASELVLDGALKIIEVALGAEATRKLRNIPVDTQTMLDLMRDMGSNICEQILDKMRLSELFSIHITESKDPKYFLICGRYFDNDCINENLLFIKPLTESSTDDLLYEIFADATSKWKLDWNKCASICVNKLRTPLENNTSFMSRLKTLMPNANIVYIPRSEDLWTRNPFNNDNCARVELPIHELRKLHTIAYDIELHQTFRTYKTENIHKFWMTLPTRYSKLSLKALKSLVTFLNPDTCEFALSRLAAIRYRVQNDSIVDKLLIVNVNKSINPDIVKLTLAKLQS